METNDPLYQEMLRRQLVEGCKPWANGAIKSGMSPPRFADTMVSLTAGVLLTNHSVPEVRDILMRATELAVEAANLWAKMRPIDRLTKDKLP